MPQKGPSSPSPFVAKPIYHPRLMTGTTFIQKSRAWFRWMFLDPRLVWALFVALGLAVFVLWFCSELIFRSSGFGLQIIGVFFAAREVFSNERLFGQPRIKDRIDGWGRRRPGKTQSIGLASLSCINCLWLGSWNCQNAQG